VLQNAMMMDVMKSSTHSQTLLLSLKYVNHKYWISHFFCLQSPNYWMQNSQITEYNWLTRYITV